MPKTGNSKPLHNPISGKLTRVGGAVFGEHQEDARTMLSGPQRYSCLVGGTRSSKTFLFMRMILVRAMAGPGSRHAILRFRANAARASIANETLPSVLRISFPSLVVERREGDIYELANGSQLYISGLDEKKRVERILGMEFATVFLNEVSQIPYSSALVAWTRLAQVVPGLRQRAYVDLNPVGRSHWTNRLFGELKDPVSGQPIADPQNYKRFFLNPGDNAHNLSPEFLKDLANLPDKQRKRFYEGVYVDEVEGALWTYEGIATGRVAPEDIPIANRAAVVIAVDPSGASGREDLGHDEIGIVVAARGTDGHGYILDDLSILGGPTEWAKRAVWAFHHWQADCIVAESNFGGEMVRATILAADPNVSVRLVTASRGKAVRAEPVSVRYAKGEVHHAGTFPKLEDQLCAFSGTGYAGADSPDHADACIWALTYLLGISNTGGMIEYLRQENAANAKAAIPGGWEFANQASGDRGKLIRLFAPSATGTFYGISGRSYWPNSDRIIEVLKMDAIPFRQAGFMPVDVDEKEEAL
jgi:phage terminase large subunit-like protein